MEIRLQKYLAECGVASRRKCEELILQNKISVNNKTVNTLGTKINPNKDIIKYMGKKVSNKKKSIYIILNKPTGYITTAKDQINRPTVLDLITDIDERIYPVGRLDADTSGLLLLTNDGSLTYKLTHPKSNTPKTYIAKIKGTPTSKELDKFRKGLKIEDYTTAPAKIQLVQVKDKTSIVKITIHEGRNRQIRKMCKKIGHPVITLERVSVGKLELGKLKESEYRHLTKKELELLR